MASRPKTLVAIIAPISIGASLAHAHGVFVLTNFIIALVSALFIQVGTNLANDYYDFLKGSDGADRVGPKRVTQSGLIAPESVRKGFVICFAAAAILGVYLIYDSGLMILGVGLASLASGLAYTAGPMPLAYVGLGELFVLVFFGPVASGFTYFVMAHELSEVAFLLGLCPGAISCAILVANNLRDVKQDARCRKRTLAVRFGENFAKVEYASCWIFAYVVLFYAAMAYESPSWLLPLLTLPVGLSLSSRVFRQNSSQALIHLLEGTAKTLALFALLLSIGIVL